MVGGTDSQLLDVNDLICQLFYMALSNLNSLDIGAHVCVDHFLNFLIECTLCADIAESECGIKTQWYKKWGDNYIFVPSYAISGGGELSLSFP